MSFAVEENIAGANPDNLAQESTLIRMNGGLIEADIA